MAARLVNDMALLRIYTWRTYPMIPINNATLQSTLDAIHDFSEINASNEDWELLSEMVDYYLSKREIPYYDEDFLPEDDEENSAYFEAKYHARHGD
jgi:hypothetical protein